MKKLFKEINVKKNVKKRVLGTVVLAGIAAASFAGCGNTSSEAAKSETVEALNQTDHLNIAVQPIPGYLPLSYLQDNGWVEEALKEEGYDNVEVTYTEFESGPPENEAFASGSQDVGVMGNVPTISAAAAGQARSILGVAYNGEKTEAVLVAQDSDITSVSDLKGKKIGLVIGSIAQDFLDRLLEKENIGSDEVELVNLASTEQQSALATHQVDAIAVWQPMIAQVEAAGTGRVLVDGTDVYKCENLISGNTEYIEENPEIVRIFIEQYARAAAEVSADTAKFSEQYAEKYSLDADIVNATISDMNFQVAITDEDIEDFQKTADWLFNSGNVKKQVVAKEIVNTEFANAVEVK
ncbi:MAG: aliphatic sulfonate ABC transporter substrate-binding protein [Lachnospiraceae bacterium]|nr:aliphatic sulfonate ABC transporter substrate-binding protein [Lachnospiraceae bacterium]